MATSPVTLPPDFNKWDNSPPASLPADFGGFDQRHNPAYEFQGGPAPPSQLPAALRFLKGAGKTYIGATLNAGPTTSTPASYGTPEWQQAEADLKAGKSPGMLQTLKNSFETIRNNISLGKVAGGVAEGLVKPISNQIERIKQDPAEGSGEALMRLLLLRQGLKSKSLPEIGKPTAYAEQVVPLSGYTKVQPQPLQASNPYSPSAAPIPDTVLPNATYLRPDMRSLSQRPPEGPSPTSNAELLRGIREHEFLLKVQDELNRQEGQPELEEAINKRMAEYAKKPWEREAQKSQPKQYMTEGSDLIKALRQMAAKKKVRTAKAGD